LQQLRAGNLEVTVTSSQERPESDAWRHWTDEMVWARGRGMAEPLPAVIPLVTRDDDRSISRGLPAAALEKVGRAWELVLTATSTSSVVSAAEHGLGLTVYATRRIGTTGLVVCQDRTLPPLPDLICRLCVRESAESKMLDELVAMMADVACPDGDILATEKLAQFARPTR
jgi:DNA-binding transcriptional LysR family regulator